MNDIDFARSFVRFSTTRVSHTPRLQLDAVCTLRDSTGERAYYMSCACIGEEMYQPSDFIHQPPQEFHIILAPGEQYMTLKRCPSADDDLRAANRINAPMPTSSGRPAKVVELAAEVARHREITPVRDYETFRDALLGNRIMNGRTIWRTDDFEAILDYPARTINAGTSETVWQVDAGPILIPSEPQEDDLEITRFNLAYIVYNRLEYAEAAVRVATPIYPKDPNSPRTSHFSRIIKMECFNELYAAYK